MNGQFPPSASTSRLSDGLLAVHGQAPVAARLLAALFASCLLHLLLIVAPYLGISASPPEAREKLPRAFVASLATPPLAGVTGAIVAHGNGDDPRASASRAEGGREEPAEGVGLLPIPATAYYPTDQLSKRPQPLAATDLESSETRAIVASGKMILKLWIDELGEVIEVEVEKSELPETFSRTAVAAFKRLRFAAGERGGVRVGSVMRIEVSYDDGRPTTPRD